MPLKSRDVQLTIFPITSKEILILIQKTREELSGAQNKKGTSQKSALTMTPETATKNSQLNSSEIKIPEKTTGIS